MSSQIVLAAVGEPFDEHRLAVFLGAIGLVVIVSGLVSGLVERGPLSQVLVFVALGVVVGPWGFDVIDLKIDSPVIQTVGTVSLILVFFTDAIKVNLGQLRSHWLLPALALGPGALLTILFIGLMATGLFDLPWSLAFLVGAVLASTDAILLRDVLNSRIVPRSVRHTLRIEAGANDVIVLPVMLALAAIATHESRTAADWLEFAVKLLLLGPLVGVAVAFVSIRAIAALRRRQLVRRDYESLYSIGVAFVAFAAAQWVGGSGFLAAFAAGLSIALIDEELCDCFLEYGETTAEMAMLITFVFLGADLVDSALDALSATTLLFAVLVLGVARPAAFLIVLARSQASRAGRLMIAWFGPRGLASLLLTILAVTAGIPDGDRIFGIVSVVVVVSILVHGISTTPLLSWYGRRLRRSDLPEEVAADAGTLLNAGDVRMREHDVPRLPPAALKGMLHAGDPVTVIDVRREAAYESSGKRIPGSVRIPIDELLDRLNEIPRDRPVVLSCA
ncbi:MAG TPA: cation:proton antiporter [Thermomicrobiales bacterium]|jgi:NhaP-type Na+/H+ or K+/H+ antiporter